MKKIILVILILYSSIFISCKDDKNNDLNLLGYFEIEDWFYNYESIDYVRVDKYELKNRDENEKNLRIKLNLIALNIDKEVGWNYISQELETKSISPVNWLIKILTVFEKNDTVAYRTQIFYYNPAELMPVPMPLEDLGNLITGTNHKTVLSNLIWNGDFDNYLKSTY